MAVPLLERLLTPVLAVLHIEILSTLDLVDEYPSRTLAGWHTHLDALADVLDGRDTDLVNLPGWEESHAAYEARDG